MNSELQINSPRTYINDGQVGRPKRDIDLEKLTHYAMMGLSNRHMADLLDCNQQLLERREDLATIIRQKRAERRLLLRRAQTAKALEGDVRMLIWLGMNELDQTNKAPAPNTHGDVIQITQLEMNRQIEDWHRRMAEASMPPPTPAAKSVVADLTDMGT